MRAPEITRLAMGGQETMLSLIVAPPFFTELHSYSCFFTKYTIYKLG